MPQFCATMLIQTISSTQTIYTSAQAQTCLHIYFLSRLNSSIMFLQNVYNQHTSSDLLPLLKRLQQYLPFIIYKTKFQLSSKEYFILCRMGLMGNFNGLCFLKQTYHRQPPQKDKQYMPRRLNSIIRPHNQSLHLSSEACLPVPQRIKH